MAAASVGDPVPVKAVRHAGRQLNPGDRRAREVRRVEDHEVAAVAALLTLLFWKSRSGYTNCS